MQAARGAGTAADSLHGFKHRDRLEREMKERTYGDQDLRHDGGGLGAADRFRPAAPRALARIKAALDKSEMGSLLCFDMNNVRYITATHIGTWAQDKSPLHAAAAGRRADPLGLRLRRAPPPAVLPVARRALARGHLHAARRDPPEMGRAEDVARKIRIELEKRGLHKEPVGVDVVEPPVLFALQKEGITVVDGQQLMSDAREIKTQDEITLLNTAA